MHLGETSHLHVNSSFSDMAEKPVREPFLSQSGNDCDVCRQQPFPRAPRDCHLEAGPGTSEAMFSTFLYWRTPLPDISKDVEVLLSGPGPLEDSHSGPEAACDSCVARNEIQKVLKGLQGPLLQDPDIQAQVQVLSAALRATQLSSTSEPESKQPEGLNEESASDPSPVSDNHILLSASSSQNELSVARILQSTLVTCSINSTGST